MPDVESDLKYGVRIGWSVDSSSWALGKLCARACEGRRPRRSFSRRRRTVLRLRRLR